VNGQEHVERGYSEGEILSDEEIRCALEPDHERYVQGSGYGVAVFRVPALPGYLSVYLVNEDGARLQFIRSECTPKAALRVMEDADILALADAFEAKCEAQR
jgi:hypothetical protein